MARSIGLIRHLQQQNCEVVFAGDERQARIIRQYFSKIRIIDHEGYDFNFRGKGRFAVDLFLSMPRLVKQLSKEKDKVELLVSEEKPDLIISDHRYGFRSEMIPSVFVTHQLQLPVEWYQSTMQIWHRNLINRFDEIWVLDYSDSRLAGKLSANRGFEKVTYIGPYSRFMDSSNANSKDIEELLIASGPDIYAQQLVDQFAQPGMTVICDEAIATPDSVQRYSGDWLQQDELIQRAKKIISRSGYSTVMDAQFLNADFTLIPTPGQREQEYLSSIK